MFKWIGSATALLALIVAAPLSAQTCVPYAFAPAGKCEATQQDITRWLPTQPISVTVDGTPIVLDPSTSPPVFLKNGRTYVELNAVFNALGLALSWDGANQRITASKDDLRFTLHQGYAYAYKYIRGRETPYLTMGSATAGWASPFIAYIPGKFWNRRSSLLAVMR